MRAILTYHSIDPSGSAISVHPEAFERHITWLTSGRVTVTSIEDLIGLPPTANAVAITFDDAYVNFRDAAAPRLLASGLPVTVFVVSDRVGGTNDWNGQPAPGIPQLPLLDWASLVHLQEQGVTLGAHGRSHADLTRLGRAQLEDEILGSRAALERETGVLPSAFAYPYGRLNPTIAGIVAGAFRVACTTEFQTLDAQATAVALPRLDMYYLQGEGRIDSWGTASFRRYLSVRRQLRRARQAVLASGVGRSAC